MSDDSPPFVPDSPVPRRPPPPAPKPAPLAQPPLVQPPPTPLAQPPPAPPDAPPLAQPPPAPKPALPALEPAPPGSAPPPAPQTPDIPSSVPTPPAPDLPPRTPAQTMLPPTLPGPPPPMLTPMPALTPTPTSASSTSGSMTAVVVGGAVGGVVLLGLAAALIFFLVYRRRRGLQPPRTEAGFLYDTRKPTTAPLQESHELSTTPSSTPPLMQSWQSGGSSLPTAVIGGTFTYDELAAATDGFSEANLLGQGGFGYVFKGTVRGGQEVAIKKLHARSGQGHREFHAEVDIISRVHHKNLVSLAGFCIHDEQRLLVYEHVPNKTLYAHLHSGAGSGRPLLDWPRRWKIAVGTAKGLAYLHDDCHPKIIHRDIKAANILLDHSFEPKVADFGLARCQEAEKTAVSTRIMGTIGYMAPEYAATGKVNDRSDVFSFGVVLLELITGRKPATESSDDDEQETLVSWARPFLARAVEEDNYEDLIDPTLEANYDAYDMTRLVACAAAAVRDTARSRPRMAQIVRYLESELSVEDLKAVMAPGRKRSTTIRGEVKQLWKMEVGPAGATGTDEHASSEMSEPVSEYTASSGPDTAETRTGATGMSAA